MTAQTNDSKFGTAKWIVSPNISDGATHTTIASALTSASSGDTIFIRPSSYTENLTLKAGVNLVAYVADAFTPNVTIIGNATATFTGTCTLSGLRLQTNSAALLTVSGSNATIVNLYDCYLNCTNNTGITFSAANTGANIFMHSCSGTLGTTGIGFFAHSSTGGMNIRYCGISNAGASVTASTNSGGGSINFYFSDLGFVYSSSSTSATGIFSTTWDTTAVNTTPVTLGGTGENVCRNSLFLSGTASGISIGTGATLQIENAVVNNSNTNVITGAGTLSFANLSLPNSSLINTTTQVPLVKANDAVRITSPGAYPYTTIPQDQVILVDTASARTITPLASPTTGQKHYIKDNVGSAAANNITITPSGKNIDGAASSTINVNYGSVLIVYNGTQWNVL